MRVRVLLTTVSDDSGAVVEEEHTLVDDKRSSFDSDFQFDARIPWEPVFEPGIEKSIGLRQMGPRTITIVLKDHSNEQKLMLFPVPPES